VPRFVDVTLPFTPHEPFGVSVRIVAVPDEVTPQNNSVFTRSYDNSPVSPAPMITGVLVRKDGWIELTGKNFEMPLRVLEADTETNDFHVFDEASDLAVIVVSDLLEPGTYLLSLQNPDDKRSNLVPITLK
jgi:hypothetical protein